MSSYFENTLSIKEESRDEGKNNKDQTGDELVMISLQQLSDLTGFSIDLLKSEFFADVPITVNEEISLKELRTAMSLYLDSAMIFEKS